MMELTMAMLRALAWWLLIICVVLAGAFIGYGVARLGLLDAISAIWVLAAKPSLSILVMLYFAVAISRLGRSRAPRSYIVGPTRPDGTTLRSFAPDEIAPVFAVHDPRLPEGPCEELRARIEALEARVSEISRRPLPPGPRL